MPRRARIHFVSLRSSLVNLPISIYGPLLERGVRPQGLAVHLTLVTPRKTSSRSGSTSKDGPGTIQGEAYVGWTGMASASSLAHFSSANGNGGDKGLETVEIDPQFAGGLAFAEGDVVEIGLLHDLGYANSVATEPLTPDDWEIIELHASHVESTLLSQVRVAAINQEIDVWVLGRTRVRLKVVSLEPSNKGKALLLTTSTEVSIAPKTRNAPLTNGTSSTSSKPIVKPVSATTITSSDASEHPTQPLVFRTLPARFFPLISPACQAFDDGRVSAIAFVNKRDVRIMAKMSVPEFGDMLRPGKGGENEEEEDVNANERGRCWEAQVWRLGPPVDPSQPSGGGSLQQEPQGPRVLNPTDPDAKAKAKTNGTTVGEEKVKNEILVTWSPHIPVDAGGVVFYGTAGGVEDWDNVRIIMKDRNPSKHRISYEEPNIPKTPVPSSSIPKLAGVDHIVQECIDFVVETYTVQLGRPLRGRGVPGLLITGRPGSGKTAIMNAVARHLQESHLTFSYIIQVDLSQYVAAPIPKLKAMMTYWLEKAVWHRPSVICFDSMDKLMGAEDEHTDSFRTRHIAELFIHYFGSTVRPSQPDSMGVVFIATADSKASLHPNLMKTHMFSEVVGVKAPGKDARKEILANLVANHFTTSDLSEDPHNPLNYTALAMETEGYLATDLKDLVGRAVAQAAVRAANYDDDEEYQPRLLPEDFTEAHKGFVPLSLRDVQLHKSDVSWADIGGLRETKRVIRETLEWPTKYAPIFAQSPLRLRQGLLLYGYPGCGKTLIASAVAKECGLNFITVKGPEILNKYIGASEQSVRELFDRASAAKPCVLFFDEFDSIAPKRGHDSTGVTDRVVNQLLTQLDGVEGLDGVYVLAATSRPDLIDSALLRPGRLDKSLLCDMPSIEDRKEILEAISRKITLSPTVDLAVIARDTEGFTGADLQALLYNAHLEVVHETIEAAKNSPSSNSTSKRRPEEEIGPVKFAILSEGADTVKEKGRVMTKAEEDELQRQLRRMIANASRKSNMDPLSMAAVDKAKESNPPVKHEIHEHHIRKVLKTTRPSVPPDELARLQRIYRAFVDDRSGELPVPPDVGGSGIGQRVTLM
ncbi:AAA-domain-containing protein [Panus rudis PR-1116 ss-1]|nr:AAA-domain-containing protein [Panus rudis PR-1116 ss-1]